MTQLEETSCNLDDLLSNIHIFQKEKILVLSGVLKMPILTTKKGEKIIMKISFEDLVEKDNSSEIEYLIYKNVISQILDKSFSPHVVSYITSYRCMRFPYTLKQGSEVFNAFIELINEQGLKIWNYNNARFLLIEYIHGPSMFDWMENAHSIEEWETVLFQILYTFQVFNIFGLRHNDTHLRNILLEMHPKKKLTYGLSNDLHFSFLPSFTSKIYDFDLSAIKGIENTVLDNEMWYFCTKMGLCNEPNTKFDTFNLLCTLYNLITEFNKTGGRNEEERFLHEFVEYCIDPNYIEHKGSKIKYGVECSFCALKKMKECAGNCEPPDHIVKSIPQILLSDFFKKYRGGSTSDSEVYRWPT